MVHTDASGYAIGYVLGQMNEGKENVIAYGGRSLSPAEKNYSVGHLEALAAVSGVKYFALYLTGRKFTLYTDNTSVAQLLALKNPTGRLARWLVYLQSFEFELVYKPGRLNGSADAISRIQNLNPGVATAETDQTFAERQIRDKILGPLIKFLKEGTEGNIPKRGMFSLENAKNFLLEENGTLMKITNHKISNYKKLDKRVVLPQEMTQEIIQELHDGLTGGHFGVNKTFTKASIKYFWPSMYKDVKKWIV